MNFRLTRAAEADLIEIYISGAQKFGIAQAERYQDRLERAFHLIGDNPKLARLRTELVPPTRIHPVEAHLIVYLADENDTVRILRVRHHSEDWVSNPLGEDG